MKILAPYILSSPLVDRWDVWVNTSDPYDLQFIEGLGREFEKVNPVLNPVDKANGNASINWFYQTAIEGNTIYIKFDDDIVWVEDGFFETLLDYRNKNREHLLVFPAIVNNAICTHLFQQAKKLNYPEYIQANSVDEIGWASPEFAADLHVWFLNHLESATVDELKFDSVPIALNRISINCFAWYGEDFSKFNGIVLDDDEEYLSVIKPRELGKINSICGNTIVSHFAFYSQRRQLDQAGILEAYESVVQANDHHSIAKMYKTVASLSLSAGHRETGLLEPCIRGIRYLRLPWLSWVSPGEFYRRLKAKFKKKERKPKIS
ncbi:MAG: hypothetical protein O3C20_01225 [Verrucomicrobia bacterium]|nr:hypothetical protein [Verrucomicrobiota bacterium]